MAIPVTLTQFTKRLTHPPKTLRVISYCVAGYFGFTFFLGLVAPYAAVKLAPQKLSALLGRPVSIQDIRINPFTFHVQVSQFRIDSASSGKFLSFNQADAEINFWSSVVHGAINIETIALDGLSLDVQRLNSPSQDRFNFSDIIDHLANQAAQETAPDLAETPAPLPRILAKNISLSSGQLSINDEITGTALGYSAIHVSLKQFDSQALLASAMSDKSDTSANANRYSVHLQDQSAGETSIQGQFQLAPLAVVGDIQLGAIQLTPFWPLIAKEMNVSLTRGQFSFESQYQLAMTDKDELAVTTNQGRLVVENIIFAHQEHTPLQLPLFAINGIGLNLTDKRIDIAAVETQGLVVNALLDKNGLDLQSIFTPKFIVQAQDNSTVSNNADAAQLTSNELIPSQDGTSTETVKKEITEPENVASKGQNAPTAHNQDWLITLGQFNLTDYDINLTEQLVTDTANQWRIYPLNLHTQQIRSDLTTPIDYDLGFAINTKGQVSSQGQVDIGQQAVNAMVSMTDFDLTQLQTYLAPYINITLESGLLSTQGRVIADAKGQAIFEGQTHLNNLLVKDNLLKQPLLKWQAMSVNQLTFNQALQQLDIDHLIFSEPYARVVITKDRNNNLSNLVIDTPEEPASTSSTTNAAIVAKVDTTPEPASPLKLTINKISFNDGSAFFADNSLTPNFASSIEKLEGEITQLSSTPGTKASVNLSGKIDKYAPVTVKGDINPLLENPYLDIDLQFKSVELTSINPYSGTYAGYYIDKGQLSLALNYQLDNNQLKGSNHLVIDQLKLGKPSDSDLATSLPITLAIALLQDRHGIIDLGLEVQGDLDSPSFSFGSIILNAIGNVITKAVTAPFSFLAGLVGSDDTLDQIAFEVGIATLSPKEQEKLASLAKALDDRPNLKLSVEGSVDAINDSKVLAEQSVKRQLAQVAGIPLTQLPLDLSASQFPTEGPLAKALKALYNTSLSADADEVKQTIVSEAGTTPLTDEQLLTRWHIALYNLCVNAQDITPSQLGDLAQARAQAVKAFLVDVHQVAPERVFLLDSRIKIDQDASQVKLTLGAD